MFSTDHLRIATYAPRDAMAPHSHDDASIGVIVGGDFIERVGKSERHYANGRVSFGPVGVVHSQKFGADGARQIIITPDAAWLSYLSECKVQLVDAPFARTPALCRLGQKLMRELERDDALSAVAREGIVLEIVAAFGRVGFGTPADAEAPRWLRIARDYLHAHACATPTMAQVARAAGRHEIHLAREFRRYFGMSVGTYLRRLKTEEAARLLLQPRANITAVALRCGFASHSHLCRVFKEHFGITPSQYRTQH
ncbi:MAG TPA: AraC family transcriptional regulator [Rhizomicrobium sp.]|jgi:AraC family transcriptional regulator|nr:AraC family transcriptional regulator [Rhizomicrobium sp.]